MVSGNGTEEKDKKGLWSEMTTLLSEHVELAFLEWGYESEQAQRRILAAAVGYVLILTAFILFQVAIVGVLMNRGLSLGLSCLILGAVYSLLAAGVLWKFGRRDPRAGRPFEGTHREAAESLKWIQKLFS